MSGRMQGSTTRRGNVHIGSEQLCLSSSTGQADEKKGAGCSYFHTGRAAVISTWTTESTQRADGRWHALCDHHRERGRKHNCEAWECKQSHINPETQALCRCCSDVFTPNQLKHQHFNVRGQFAHKAKVDLCPDHCAEKKCKRSETWKRMREAMVQDVLEQLESHAAGKTGCACGKCQLDRETLCKELEEMHGDDIGERFFSCSFDCNHEPRRIDRKCVTQIRNPVLRRAL